MKIAGMEVSFLFELSPEGVAMEFLARPSRILCILSLAAMPIICSAQSSYTVTDLGTIDTNGYSSAMAVNSIGQVTGAAGSTKTITSETFLYSNGGMASLGTLGGTSGIGNGINSSGQVVGYSQNSKNIYRAFISSGSVLTDIGDLGGGSAVAYGVNDFSQVVGSAVTADGSNHPFLYSNGTMTDLGTLGSPKGNSWWNVASGINNAGTITGTSYDAHGNFFGFVYKNGKMTKMGTLGGAWSQGYAINNKGQVTGVGYTKNGSAHAFITNCATCPMRDLGTFAGAFSTVWGTGINDAGVVVGRSTFSNTYHAFVYSGGKIKDLNTMIPAGSGWVLVEASSINAAGQIVGDGTHNSATHAFLLTPQ
jgi:probable HAF family extracellular repeat protein